MLQSPRASQSARAPPRSSPPSQSQPVNTVETRRPFLSLRRPRRSEGRATPDTAGGQASTRHAGSGQHRRRHPEALPGEYNCPFNGPVDGVAIIGCGLSRTQEEREAEEAFSVAMAELVELVPPRRADAPMSPNAPLPSHLLSAGAFTREFPKRGDATPTDTSASDHERTDLDTARSSRNVIATGPSENRSSEPSLVFESTGRASVTREGSVSEYSASASTVTPRRVLNRGYILFTDEFAAEHPHLAVSETTRTFQDVFSGVDTALHVDPARSASQQQQSDVSRYMSLAEHEMRPLFRRRSSSLVYGRAAYSPKPKA